MKKVLCTAAIVVLGAMLFMLFKNAVNLSGEGKKAEDTEKKRLSTRPFHLSELTPQAGFTAEGGQGTDKILGSDVKISGTVVIDAGHGGKDMGCSFDGTDEKDVNLLVALGVKERLETAGVEVILTRSSDEFVSLEDRANLANASEADCFVSIHCNSFEDETVSGLEGYWFKSEKGKSLSESILRQAGGNLINVRKTKEEDYFVLRETAMPATLIEIGYLSNENEREMLKSSKYQSTVSASIAEGILDWLSCN